MAACNFAGNDYVAEHPIAPPMTGGYDTGYAQPAIPDMPNPFTPGDDCEDCGELVRTTKKVQVPCTRNTYRQFEIKVPRQVTEKVARNVKYVDYENRPKEVCYTVNREETRYKEEQQCYTVPVQKTKTRMVNVTKKVPKTIYVDVTVQEPQTYTVVEQETRHKLVKIPYTVNVPETRTKVVQEKCPVEKTKVVYDDVCKTVYDTQVKTECRPVTKMVVKEIPVYHWRQKQPAPCNQPEPIRPIIPEPQPQPVPQPDMLRVKKTYEAPSKYDVDGDGVLDEGERALAARDGELKVKEEIVGKTVQPNEPDMMRASGGSGSGMQAAGQGMEQGAADAAADAQMRARQEAEAQAAAAQARARAAGRSRSRSRSTGRKRSSSRGRSSSSRRRSGKTSSRTSSRRKRY